jgi:hypothetical protein
MQKSCLIKGNRKVDMNIVPGKSFLSYLGGKSQLAKKIIPKIPEHTCYCEVFAGASWLLFKKEELKTRIFQLEILATCCNYCGNAEF